jgi:hypothetical protein
MTSGTMTVREAAVSSASFSFTFPVGPQSLALTMIRFAAGS